MSSGDLVGFDRESARRLADTVRDLEAKQRGLEARLEAMTRRSTGDAGFEVARGVTTVSTEFPNYPQDGCQFVVLVEDHEFPETVDGTCPAMTVRQTALMVIARTIDGSYLPQGTAVALIKAQNPSGRRWWIIPLPNVETIEIEPLMLKDPTWLQPGERNKSANLLVLDGSTGLWAEKPGYLPGDPATHQLLFDDFHRNMIGPGEVVYAKRRPFHAQQNPLENQWDIIGSQGLERWGKVDGDTACGDEGFWTVYRDEPTLYQETLDCYGGGQISGIPFCNARGHRRKVRSSEWLMMHYDLGQRKWYPVRDIRPMHAFGVAGGDFCQASQVALNSPFYTDWANDDCTFDAADVSVAENSNYRLAGESGDLIEVRWDERSENWAAVQVTEHLDAFVEDVSEVDNQGCPQLWRDRKFMVGHRSPACGIPTEGGFFNFVTTVAVEDIRQNPADPCAYQFRTRDLCVGAASTPSAYRAFLTAVEISVLDSVAITGGADLGTCAIGFGITRFCAINPQTGTATQISMQNLDVVTDVRDEADGLYKDYRTISVICIGTPQAALVVEYNDCQPASP